MAYIGAGDWVTAAKRRPPGGELTTTEQTANRALSAARAPSNEAWSAFIGEVRAGRTA